MRVGPKRNRILFELDPGQAIMQQKVHVCGACVDGKSYAYQTLIRITMTM